MFFGFYLPIGAIAYSLIYSLQQKKRIKERERKYHSQNFQEITNNEKEGDGEEDYDETDEEENLFVEEDINLALNGSGGFNDTLAMDKNISLKFDREIGEYNGSIFHHGKKGRRKDKKSWYRSNSGVSSNSDASK